ncbi:MAG: 16S rRNA (cytosine(967)-C(5))-methyltransferase RsmB [Myxococcales bacterium]|nr:16S rRNA (cytosine(967)-C(5))-methyltransferase RsmB [Myxococcales bacterium]
MLKRDGRKRGAPTRTRLIALRVLERVQRAGAFADLLLHNTLARSSLAAADRAFATELVYGTLRWRGRIDFLLGQLLVKDLEKLEPLVATALRIGAYQILFTDRVPANAAVDESVRCIRAAGVERATGLVNAVLRRLATEHANISLPTLEDDPLEHLTHTLSLPPWIAARWLELYGPEQAAALAIASNNPPPLVVRVNRAKITRDALLDDLRTRFPDAAACRISTDGIVLGRRGNPAVDPAFVDGRFSVQDEASQLVVDLLDPQPGERVLDACAAPGGKTTAIAERVGTNGSVMALDRHSRRLELVRRSARRLGHDNIECAEYDATHSLANRFPEGSFDRVLVDAPCSGLGSLRRNPDARWRIGPNDPARLAEKQITILRNAAAVLRSGGTLVYSTCTLLPEENEDIVESFSSRPPSSGSSFSLAPRADGGSLEPVLDERGFLRTLPHRDDADGFFAAKWLRNP